MKAIDDIIVGECEKRSVSKIKVHDYRLAIS